VHCPPSQIRRSPARSAFCCILHYQPLLLARYYRSIQSNYYSRMSASEIQKKILEIEDEITRTQKNKATNYHIGTLKAKLAKLRSELLDGPGGKSSGTKNAERGFDVTKSGDTRIGLGELLCLLALLWNDSRDAEL